MQGSVGAFDLYDDASGKWRFNDSYYVPARWFVAMYTADCNGATSGQQDLYRYQSYTINCPVSWIYGQSGGYAINPVPAEYWNVEQTAPPPPTPGSPGTVTGNTYLYPGQSWYSPDGSISLDYQGDGNLVLYRNHSQPALWATGTNWNNPGFTVMATAGNLVVYDPAGNVQWASGTEGNTGAYLGISNSGGFVIYRTDGSAAWWTGTGSL
jgi:hypothetical protein